MKTVVLGSRTPELEARLAERRRLGQDRLDEIWEGEYHMVPGPSGRHGHIDGELVLALHAPAQRAGLRLTIQCNIGEPDDLRVPDQGWHRGSIDRTYFDTAALVVEVLSPGDETWLKFDFFARHGVEELLIADPDTNTIHWFRLAGDDYERVERSELLGLTVEEVTRTVAW